MSLAALSAGFGERRGLEDHLVDVAPAPVLTRLEGLDQRIVRVAVVLRRVLVGRVVTAAYVAAAQAQSQVDPLTADLQALLAALWRVRADVVHLVQVRARRRLVGRHTCSPHPFRSWARRCSSAHWRTHGRTTLQFSSKETAESFSAPVLC